MSSPRISTEYTYRGIDAAFLENHHLRVLVLPGKGGDIIEFRDKRTDVLWQTPHNWSAPNQRYVPSVESETWQDHYPGGWQVNLPVAGDGLDIGGNAYGLHGESALVPWDARIVHDDASAVTLRLRTELIRYPFVIERNLTLPADESQLEVTETVTNNGAIELEYIWQQHLTLGQPLVDPAAQIHVPASKGIVEEYGDEYPNARLKSAETFEWPIAPTADGGSTDLREIPPRQRIHDLAFLTDLQDGWYALTNPSLDLGFTFAFPTDPFECIWYWQPFGGFDSSPFFGRNYNVGLEPTSSYPSSSIPEAQRMNGTMKALASGESVTAKFIATTFSSDANPKAIINRDR